MSFCGSTASALADRTEKIKADVNIFCKSFMSITLGLLMFVIGSADAHGREKRDAHSPRSVYLCKMDATIDPWGILLLLQSIVYRVTREGARFPAQLIRYRVKDSKQ